MAMSLASADDACTNGAVFVEDISLAGMIQAEGKYQDHGKLAQAFRQRMPDTATGASYDGYYSDRGYNKRPGTYCEDASHVHAY